MNISTGDFYNTRSFENACAYCSNVISKLRSEISKLGGNLKIGRLFRYRYAVSNCAQRNFEIAQITNRAEHMHAQDVHKP